MLSDASECLLQRHVTNKEVRNRTRDGIGVSDDLLAMIKMVCMVTFKDPLARQG